MDSNFPIQNVVLIIGTLLFLKGMLFMVKQKHAVIIERLGKFNKVSKAGLHLKIPLIDSIAGNVNLRVRELPCGDLIPQIEEGITRVEWCNKQEVNKRLENSFANIKDVIHISDL